MTTKEDENGISDLRISIRSLHDSIEQLRNERNKPWDVDPIPNIDRTGWNFATYSVHINQRFSDLSLQLQQRFEAQQAGVTTAMIAAEKAVNSALTAAEKAVDKAEQAQALRNEAQNEFRKSLSDLSGLMWTTKEGTAALDSLRRECDVRVSNAEDKVNAAARDRAIQIETLRREMSLHVEGIEKKVGELATDAANMQGRFTMIGIVWGVIVVVISAAIRWFK